MSKLILTLIILCSFTASIFAAETAKRGTAAVALGAGVIDNSTPDEPSPSPNGPKVPRSKCKVCKGTGYIINGDGNRSECPNCVPDNSPDDSPFDKSGNPRIVPVRPQPQAKACPCATGGECTCKCNGALVVTKVVDGEVVEEHTCICGKDCKCTIKGSPTTQSVGKCCADCVCGAGCACSYPGECLVKANGGKKVVICDEAAGTCRVYAPKSGVHIPVPPYVPSVPLDPDWAKPKPRPVPPGPHYQAPTEEAQGPVVHPNVGPRPYPPVIEPIKDHGEVFAPTAEDNENKVAVVANEMVYAAGKEYKAGQYHKAALYIVQADALINGYESDKSSDTPEMAKAKRRIEKARKMLSEKGITKLGPVVVLPRDAYNNYVSSMKSYVASQQAKATVFDGGYFMGNGGSCAGGSCGSSMMMGDGGGCSGGSCGGGMGGFGFGRMFGGGGGSCGAGGCR